MMKGIDISNWQANLIPSKLDVDFCICKATEGTGFVDKFCDAFIQNCKSMGILYGFYHFAGTEDPYSEAQFFYNNCKGYVGEGVPVLDYEVWGLNDDVGWCELFLAEFHRLAGVWPLLYISASHCNDFANSWIPQTCGLWIAGYPTDMKEFPLINADGDFKGIVEKQTQKDKYILTVEMPYDCAPWDFVAIWQFTSGLRLEGYNGSLDGDIAYMDEKGWKAYAGVNNWEKPADPEPKPKQKEKMKINVTVDGKKYAGWIREK